MEEVLDKRWDTYAVALGFLLPPRVQVQASGMNATSPFLTFWERRGDLVSQLLSNEQLKHPSACSTTFIRTFMCGISGLCDFQGRSDRLSPGYL